MINLICLVNISLDVNEQLLIPSPCLPMTKWQLISAKTLCFLLLRTCCPEEKQLHRISTAESTAQKHISMLL